MLVSQKAYRALMLDTLEESALKIVRDWEGKGRRFLTKAELRKVRRGCLPCRTKIGKLGQRGDHRPIVQTKRAETRRAFVRW